MTHKKELYHGISSKSPRERVIIFWTVATIAVISLHIYTYSLIGLPPAQPVGVWQTVVFTIMIIATSAYGLPVVFLGLYGLVYFSVIASTCYSLFVEKGNIKGWWKASKEDMQGNPGN